METRPRITDMNRRIARRARFIGASLALGLLASGAFMGACRACVCGLATVPQRFERTAAVFVGRVVDVSYSNREIVVVGTKVNMDIARHTFAVKAVWKGEVVDTLHVETELSSSCAYAFPEGLDCVVYAEERDGRLMSGLCSGNRPVDAAIYERYWLGDPIATYGGFRLSRIEFDELFEYAKSDDKAARMSAVSALGTLEDERQPIVARLAAMMETGTEDDQILVMLVARAMGGEAGTLLPEIELALKSGTEQVRAEAAETLVSVVGRKRYYPYAAIALQDSSDQVRLRAAQQIPCMKECLAREQRRVLTALLANLIDSTNPAVRGRAITGLVACGESAMDLLPTLDRVAQDDVDKWVRYCARLTVSRLRKEDGLRQ